MDQRYKNGRTFALNNEEIQEILWCDDSDDELPTVDDEDIAVLEEGVEEGQQFVEITAAADPDILNEEPNVPLAANEPKFDTAVDARAIKWSRNVEDPLPPKTQPYEFGKLSDDVAAAETPFQSFMATSDMNAAACVRLTVSTIAVKFRVLAVAHTSASTIYATASRMHTTNSCEC